MREAARLAICQSKLTQVTLGVLSYEDSFGHLPAGVIDRSTPVRHVPSGYKHNWISGILPFVEEFNLHNAIDFEVGVFANGNIKARQVIPNLLRCPSTPQSLNSSYVGIYNDVEKPISAGANGLMFLNSALRRRDIPDGMSTTFLLGETMPDARCLLGWMSGTRDTLRNVEGIAPIRPNFLPKQLLDIEAARSDFLPTDIDWNPSASSPRDPFLEVGQVDSIHSVVQLSFGDGRVIGMSRFTAPQVLQQLGNRQDQLPLTVPEF